MRENKFTWLLQQFYMIILASLMFWVNILRGFVLYGCTYAFAKSFAYLRASYYDKYREITKQIRIKLDGSNLIAIFTLCLTLIVTRFPLSNLTTFIILVSSAYFILVLVYIIFKTYYNLGKFIDIMQKIMENWPLAIYTMMLVILALILTGFSKILFIIFLPGVFCKMLIMVFKHLDKPKINQ